MMRTRVDPYARAAIVLLLLLVIGCSDEEPAPTACGPAGTIQGRLFGAAGPIQAAHLTFYSVSRMWNEPQTTVVAETDAEGRFAASVPAGSYTLLAEVGDGEYSYSGGRLSQAHWPLDTIAVRTGEVAAPLVFGFGSLQARVQVHPSLEGRRLCATLENWTGRGTYCEVPRDGTGRERRGH